MNLVKCAILINILILNSSFGNPIGEANEQNNVESVAVNSTQPNNHKNLLERMQNDDRLKKFQFLLDKAALNRLTKCENNEKSSTILCNIYYEMLLNLSSIQSGDLKPIELKFSEMLKQSSADEKLCDSLGKVLPDNSAAPIEGNNKNETKKIFDFLKSQVKCLHICMPLNKDFEVEVNPFCLAINWGYSTIIQLMADASSKIAKTVENDAKPAGKSNETSPTLELSSPVYSLKAEDIKANVANATKDLTNSLPVISKQDVAENKVNPPEKLDEAKPLNENTINLPPKQPQDENKQDDDQQPDVNIFDPTETKTKDEDPEQEYSDGVDDDDDDDLMAGAGNVNANNQQNPKPILSKPSSSLNDGDSDGNSVSSPDAAPIVQQTVPDVFFQENDSNFFSYFLFLMFVCILCYIAYHNKTKVLALVLEGRRSSNGRSTGGRRKHSAAYRKLDSNLEEAITSSNDSNNRSSSQIIY
uniref:Putative conserved plasma membrane protein n=1 Tax=Corethrella appendiculata TaxID=1370023 RepID=U5EML6_9DIPT